MAENPATTPQALRAQAEHALRLADGVADQRAKMVLLDFAEELLRKAADLEADSGI